MTGIDASVGQPAGRSRAPLLALYAASGLSLLGNELTALALPWLVLSGLGNAFDTGLVGFGMAIPAVIGAIGGGVLVDRLGSRETSVLADLASAVAIAAVPLAAITFGLTIPLLVVLAFAGALLDAPGMTARQVLIDDLAERAGVSLERANGLYQTVTNVCVLAGPLLGGVVIVAVGATNAMWLDAATFVISALAVWIWIPRRRPAPTERTERVDLGLGLRVVARDRLLRGLTLVCVLANFVGTPLFVVILPLMATSLPGGAGSLGLMVAAFGGGLAVGSSVVGIRGGRLPRRALLAGGFAGTGAMFGLLAIPLPFPAVLLVLAAAGLASGPINPIAFGTIQRRLPADVQGRAFGAILGGIMVAVPLGMIVVGELARRGGPPLPLALAGAGFLVVATAIALRPEFSDLQATPRPDSV